MARHAEGWKIHCPEGRTIYLVRFTHNGARVERSTGASDPREAAKAAALIYSDYIQRNPGKRARVRRGDSPPLEDCVAAWLSADSTIAKRTLPVWTGYGRLWCSRWQTLADVTSATSAEYRNDRLRVVLAATVRKELGALKRFVGWCSAQGYLGEREVDVPKVPKKATGTRDPRRHRTTAPEVSPAQVEAALAALPEWAAKLKKNSPRYPVRARFVVAYETGLRPTFLDELSAPEHYRKGEPVIRIQVEHDKNRFEREVPLTKRAREALDAICPDVGPIFGKHDYRAHIRRAAFASMPRSAAEVFTGAHFRSASATHSLEEIGNVPGAMHRFGWKLVSTVSKYTKSSQRAAAVVVAALDAARERREKSEAG